MPSTGAPLRVTMIDVKRVSIVVVIIAMLAAACSQVPASSSSADLPTPTAGGSSASASAATPTPTSETTPTPSSELVFRALDLPAEFSRGSAEAVDGTTAVGWVTRVGANIDDQQPAVWDTSSGALRVLTVPEQFVHPNGDMFVRLVGVSGTIAVGMGPIGTGADRGTDRAMAWDLETGDVRILDVPVDFERSEVHAIDGTTAVGQVWSGDGMSGAAVAWDTATGAVQILKLPAAYACGSPLAISGETVVGIRCDLDDAMPIAWDSLTAVTRDLDRLPSTADGIPYSVDGSTAVGRCCFGEEATPLPLTWDTTTGAVRQLDLPAGAPYGSAVGVSGNVAVGRSDAGPLVWDLATGSVGILPAPTGYDEQYGARAVDGRVIVGTACEPPASSSENPRCVAAAWTLP